MKRVNVDRGVDGKNMWECGGWTSESALLTYN